MANHYESLFRRFQKIPATIAYGEVNCGKTTATKAALAMVGVQQKNWFKAISDAKSYRYVCMCSVCM